MAWRMDKTDMNSLDYYQDSKNCRPWSANTAVNLILLYLFPKIKSDLVKSKNYEPLHHAIFLFHVISSILDKSEFYLFCSKNSFHLYSPLTIPDPWQHFVKCQLFEKVGVICLPACLSLDCTKACPRDSKTKHVQQTVLIHFHTLTTWVILLGRG